MAKVYIERAYIEDYDDDESSDILIHLKEGNNHTFLTQVKLDKKPIWILMRNMDNGDIHINNSAGMEDYKWDHITKGILDDE